MTLLARRPSHYCTLPEFPQPGDLARCTECGQHWVRRRGEMGYGTWWDDISPRKARSLIRGYQRQQAAIDKLIANGPYDPIQTTVAHRGTIPHEQPPQTQHPHPQPTPRKDQP